MYTAFALLILPYLAFCSASLCGPPPTITHGVVEPGDFTVGTKRQIQCNTGYHLLGTESIVCMTDGTWLVDGYCSEVGHCGHVPAIANAMISEGQSTFGSIRTFSCNEGFMVNGSAMIQCMTDRNWHTHGSCIADSCGPVPQIENGRILGGSSKTGSSRRVACFHGFGLTGRDTITCTASRTWRVDTSCIAVAYTHELFDAASRGDLPRMSLLMQQGADVDAKDADGNTPLMKAAQTGRYDAVKLLMERGAQINSKSRLQTTALIYASELGHIDIVRLLIDNGADLNAQDEDGDTALIVAVWDGHFTVAKALVEAGCDLNLRNAEGRTALSYAAENSSLFPIETLLKDHGAVLR